MKKLIIILPVLVFALALTVAPVFAFGFNMPQQKTSITTTSNNISTVDNTVKTVSNTGKNATGGYIFGGTITTNTASAGADVTTIAGSNKTIVGSTKGTVKVTSNNMTYVENDVTTVANTGKNISSAGNISSGAAGASSTVYTMLGSNVTVVK